MDIFSLAEHTEIKIFKFVEQKSALGSCYSDLSIEIKNDSIEINGTPSSLCNAQIINTTENTLQEAIITINGLNFPLDPKIVSNKYVRPFSITEDFKEQLDQLNNAKIAV